MSRDYGSAGRIAIATPQANVTVEAEFGVLLPRQATLHVTRLQSRAADSRGRLIDYLENLDASVVSFDSFRPDAFGFACTGSSYFLGAAREAEILAEIQSRTGLSIDTATAAIRWRLDQLGARRIALLSPYPQDLAEAATRFWEQAGLSIVRTANVAIASADTRGIYELRAADAARVLAGLDLSGLDAVLVSGTGMPSLPLIAQWPHALPLLSSNLCLAVRLLDRIGRPGALAGWPSRLAEAL